MSFEKSTPLYLSCKFFLFSFSFVLVGLVQANTSYVVLGHLKGVIQNQVIMSQLFKKIDSLNPDYIFVLGDSSLNKKEIFSLFYSKFQEKIFFSPGNSEMDDSNLKSYQKNVGYLNKIVESDDVRFILLNSLDSIENIKKFIKRAVKDNPVKTQVLLTHHRIWDDTLTSELPYQHDKSYYFKELYPLLSGRVKVIFSGNSKRQYFGDYRVMTSKQNVNNIYWVDQVGDISGYSIGAGDGVPKLGFVYVENIGDRLVVEPQHIYIDNINPIPISKISPDINSIKPASEGVISENNKFSIMEAFRKKISYKKALFFGLLIGAILGFFLRTLLIKKGQDGEY